MESVPVRKPFLAGLVMAACLGLGATAVVAGERYWPPIVDPPTGSWSPGKWVWADLVTSDVGRAAEFYGAVFGWTFETYGGEDDADTYTLVLADGVPVGGLVFDDRPARAQAAAARWIGLMSVPDVGAAVQAAKAAGGQVAMPARVLGQRGETAALVDPEGALFGVVRSAGGDPGDFLGEVGEWLWIELWAAQPERMAGFYQAVGGYEPAAPASPDARLAFILGQGGRARAGILPRPAEVRNSAWLPYVRVADLPAAMERARAAGALAMAGPFTRGTATVAVMVDPLGAPIAMAELARPDGDAP
jgi:predicted enzyme related to lactoylglutathione lyase